MNLEKLKEVITFTAREEAEKLLKEVQKEIKEYIDSELVKLNTYYNERKDKIEQEFSSKIAYIKFSVESDYRKKILRTKHNLIEEIKTLLTNSFLEEIERNPSKFVTYTLRSINTKEGTYLISKELENIVTEQIFKHCSKNISSFSMRFGGIDSEIEAGVAVTLSNKKYIFSVSELIDRFIDRNSQYLSELLALNE